MKLTIRYFSIYPLLLLLIFSATSFSLYLLNPFGNACIKGNCENGYGTYQYGSGMRYEGEWENGKRHGQGTLQYSDGSNYSGSWKNDRMHGLGIKTYPSARALREYNGEWKNGNKHGKGIAINLSGSRYNGDWKDGKMHGQGAITTLDGKKIIGEWENGTMYGTITEIYPDGKMLVVGLKDEKRNGRGTLTYPDGTKITGEWINNKLVGSLEFYLFIGLEFEKNYDVTTLCNAIKEDISISLNAKENTVAWLNELLKIPNLYEKFNKKVEGAESYQKINALIERTKDLRHKKFSNLSNENKKDIIKLNRLLLEHLYPAKTPKAE